MHGSTLGVCLSHLNERSVPDLAVECLDVWGQVHVQQQVILDETPQSLIPIPTLKMFILPCHDLIPSVQPQTAFTDRVQSDSYSITAIECVALVEHKVSV